jgi:hypothetical protein
VPIQELTTSLCNLLALVHPEDGGDTILRNVGSYKSHGVISQKMIIIIKFISSAITSHNNNLLYHITTCYATYSQAFVIAIWAFYVVIYT